jgi:tetratricopeptide (TPR) repeat protein
MMLGYNWEPGVETVREGIRLGLRSQNFEVVAAGWGQLIYLLGIASGRTEEGYAAAEQAIALLEGLPNGEQRLAGVLGRRGALHSLTGRHDEAVADQRRTVELRLRQLGPTHPETATAIYYLGVALTDRGDLAEGAEQLREALDLIGEHVSRSHLIAGIAAVDLASNLVALDRPAEALQVLDAAAPTLDDALGKDAFAYRARFHAKRGAALAALGREPEADAEHRIALDRYERALAAAGSLPIRCRLAAGVDHSRRALGLPGLAAPDGCPAPP